MRKYRILVVVGIFLLLTLGYGAKIPTVFAITSEQPGIADVFGEVDANCSSGWCGYFEDPNKTMLSYAAVVIDTGGLCSGAFIGPNILMTASHCGGPQARPTSITYLGTEIANPGSQTVSKWRPVTCNLLLGSIQQDLPPVWYRGGADVQLFYCADVAVRGQQIPPGLLLGALDFDLREVNMNEPVYRLWWNFIVDRGNQDHLLISQGKVINTSGTYGFQNTPAYSDNTCVNQGASGSPGMSPTWQRILIGPLDSGGAFPNLPCSPVTRGAKAHSIFETFYLDPGLYPVQFSASTIMSLGLAPALYSGWQDKNENYVLDIQEDYERVRGEVKRDHYWYNFDSRRQNSLWQEFANTQVYPDHVTPPGPPYGIVNLDATRSETLYRNDTFPLEPNTIYRVSFKLLRVARANSSQALQFSVSDPSVMPIPIPTIVSQNPFRVTFRFTTGGVVQPGIRFDATASIRADIQVLSIIKEGSIMDFDTFDKRGGWRNQNTSGFALILPDGLTAASGAAPDFALVLTHNSSLPSTSDWSALNEHLALVPGDAYRICFKTKSSNGNPSGRTEAVTGTGVVLSSLDFATSSFNWIDACLPRFTAQYDTRLRFGSRTTGGNHILVDSIAITRVSPPVPSIPAPPPPGGGTLSPVPTLEGERCESNQRCCGRFPDGSCEKCISGNQSCP